MFYNLPVMVMILVEVKKHLTCSADLNVISFQVGEVIPAKNHVDSPHLWKQAPNAPQPPPFSHTFVNPLYDLIVFCKFLIVI